MLPAEQTTWVVERARAAGFDLCGVASLNAEAFSASNMRQFSGAAPFDELRHLPEWLARGYAGEMKYLHDPRRADPRSVLPGARSVIVTAMNYQSAQPLSSETPGGTPDDSPHGWISRYAWGDDYHETILPKLNALIAEMRTAFEQPFEARAYVDTGPILERVAAKYAGLGWLAKNTCLINRKLGSWLFLGVILTTLDLAPSLALGEAPPADLCGSCTRCLDACPTHAFPEPYVLDARRCISYLTIELRSAIPEEFRSSMGRAAIGCDICQDVCPWNRKAPVTHLAAFQPRAVDGLPPTSADLSGDVRVENEDARPAQSRSLLAPELAWLASLSQQDFSRVFRRSAVKRAKWRGLVRNACVALGNSGVLHGSPEFPRIIGLLDRLAASGDPLISEHARWALDRLSSQSRA
ncbi:MAG TPA: tRNA epoxyqueuosine(34) reductase QueG [Candidatus Dormibacteraeota bacterium]|nr:tRNA epoxyqueuosine(34) reductase QueG [Candidatus Dormibacteraeota bacterium]